jgi:hypothetical protein
MKAKRFRLLFAAVVALAACQPAAAAPAVRGVTSASSAPAQAAALIEVAAVLAAPAPPATPAPTTSAPAHAAVDLSQLPLGDGRISSAPQTGYVWSCVPPNANAGGAFTAGPWISGNTFDFTAKAVVDGAVIWPSQFAITRQGAQRLVTGNGLPNHATGVYPIARDDDAFRYDRNPNSIRSQTVSLSLPALPQVAAQPSCLNGGMIGVLLSGSALFDALDGPGRDAVAHETQDGCQGHPERTGQYHYHNLTTCLADDAAGHSALMGYALDGFGIYGPYGEDGRALTNADLDACHGHTHVIEWDGRLVEMYHYHAAFEYPYTLGCFRGTPVRVTQSGGAPQGGGAGGPPAGGGLAGAPPPGGPRRPRPPVN